MIRSVIVRLWTTDRAHVLKVIGASPHIDEFAVNFLYTRSMQGMFGASASCIC